MKRLKKEHYGQELILDLHDVSPDMFHTKVLKKFAEDLCDEIGILVKTYSFTNFKRRFRYP